MMWFLVACGPLALLATAFSHAKPAPAAPTQTVTPTDSGLGPGGFAQLYVAAYLRSGAGDDELRSFFPDAPDLTGKPGTRAATATTVVSISQASRGYWSVIVAADEATTSAGVAHDAGLHYFQVPVVASGASTRPSYVATALPAEVSAPVMATEPRLGYDTAFPVPSGSLTAAVTQFLTAYLTGSGNLSRYLAPGVAMAPVTPPPYTSIQPVSVYPRTGTSPDAAGTPASGTRLRVLTQVEAIDSSGQQWPLTYALTLTAVAGQWDIAAIDPGPALGSSSSP